LELSQLFVESGVSASIPLAERPAGAQLLAALRPGDSVISAKLDRMFRDRRYRQRDFRRRVKIADENGFVYDSESFASFEDQLLKWEREQAEKRREEEMDEWLRKYHPDRWRLKQSLGPDAWEDLLREEAARRL
jgi:DNA invertase Pin-like site-specific DNA recombinase